MPYFSTDLMLADQMTKELVQEKFSALINAMMLEDTRLSDARDLKSMRLLGLVSGENTDLAGSVTRIDLCLRKHDYFQLRIILTNLTSTYTSGVFGRFCSSERR